MKKIIFSIILITVLCVSLDISAQTYNTGKIKFDPTSLHAMSQTKRDSILLSVSKEALLRYAPKYCENTARIEIEDLGNYNMLDTYRRQSIRTYKVTYYLNNATSEELAEVYVKSDSGKVMEIEFDKDWGYYALDQIAEGEAPKEFMVWHDGGVNIIKRASIYELSPTGDSLWYRQNDAGEMIRTDREGNDLVPVYDAGESAGRFTNKQP